MSNITRSDFINISFSSLLGLLLAGLIGCFNKIIPVNMIKNTTTTGTAKDTSAEESANSTKEQPQNETTSTSQTGNKAVIGIAGGKDKISVMVAKAIELAGGLGFIKRAARF